MAKIVVTGTTGFIGKHLLSELLSSNLIKCEEVFCFTRQNNPEIDSPSIVKIVTADLNNLSEDHTKLIRSSDYVFHLAANPSVDAGHQGYQDNIASTKAMLSCLKGSSHIKRLVFLSSIGAVDRSSCKPDMPPLTEESSSFPQSLYGKSKLECEQLLQSAGIPFTIIRPAWVYGKGMRENTHLKALYNMALKSSVLVNVNFPGRVSLTKVESLVKFIVHCATSEETKDQLFFYSTSDPVSIGSILQFMRETLHGQLGTQLKIPSGIIRQISLLSSFLPLKLRILLFDFLVCSSEKARKAAPFIESSFSARSEIVALTRTISRERSSFAINSAESRYVVISGAGSGIGKALSHLLYNRGYTPILVDRDKAALDKISQDLDNALTWHADLESPKERALVCTRISEFEGDLIGVINCAGRGLKVPFQEATLVEQKSLISLNVDALVDISHAALQRFKRSPATEKFLVNISSSSAFQPLPYFAIYSATKAFVLQFSQSLVGEYQDSSVRILTIAPGGTSTRFQDSAGVATATTERLLSPFYVADQIINAIEKNKQGLIVIGRRALAMEILGRLLGPQHSVKLWRNLVLKMR